MKSKTGVDYQFGVKNNWRRWQWNRIVERLRVLNKRPKNCLVLYLPGEKDLDRPVALSKRFSPDNLIAVEADKTVVDKLRVRGVNCIHGDLGKVIENWPDKEPRIDVVVADYCCGITEVVATFIESFNFTPGVSDKFVVSINMLRGRDSWSNFLREQDTVFGKHDQKHRGMQFVYFLMQPYLHAMEMVAEDICNCQHCGASAEKNVVFQEKFMKHNWARLYDYTKPEFQTYSSVMGNMKMDSVVFIWGKTVCNLHDGQEDIIVEHIQSEKSEAVLMYEKKRKLLSDKSVIARISAAKAVRTMRLEVGV